MTAPSLQSCREQPSHNSWPPVLLVTAVEGAGEEMEGRGEGKKIKGPHFVEGEGGGEWPKEIGSQGDALQVGGMVHWPLQPCFRAFSPFPRGCLSP